MSECDSDCRQEKEGTKADNATGGDENADSEASHESSSTTGGVKCDDDEAEGDDVDGNGVQSDSATGGVDESDGAAVGDNNDETDIRRRAVPDSSSEGNSGAMCKVADEAADRDEWTHDLACDCCGMHVATTDATVIFKGLSFAIEAEEKTDEDASAMAAVSDEEAEMYLRKVHQRLGHAGLKVIRQLVATDVFVWCNQGCNYIVDQIGNVRIGFNCSTVGV